jgi:cytochrome c
MSVSMSMSVRVTGMFRAGAAAVMMCVCAGGAALAADAEHGKQLFVACAACHSEKADGIGPSLKGVYGRKSAALEDFRYSNPMKRANLVWNAENLRAYLIDPPLVTRSCHGRHQSTLARENVATKLLYRPDKLRRVERLQGVDCFHDLRFHVPFELP